MTDFDLYLLKPTRYDNEGYPIQWLRSNIPSNSLACLYGIAGDAVARGVLGDAKVTIHAVDEYNSAIYPQKIIKKIKKSGAKALIAMVGVQTNQFPRTVDMAREFIAAGLPVCVGGFHVSGCYSMLKDLPPDILEARDMGISFFLGEAEENRFDEVLRDAYAGALKPLYDHSKDTPSIENAPMPTLPSAVVKKTYDSYASFDLGRGCPFDCSFCTIINVQGRKSRFRTADDLEAIIRDNAARGINRFFLTDDNFARNKNWKAYTDRLIKLRGEGLPISMLVQVDTLTHRIPGFIESVVAAGADKIFIGLESINPDSLEAVNKKQNRIEEFREMFLAWKRHPVLVICGYIIGFPGDTKQSVLRDIETIKTYFPIDAINLSYLTPLPGSADHKKLYEAGIWMDPDMNKYNLFNRVTHHPVMSDDEWEEAFRAANDSFYSWDHMERILKRMVALGSNKKKATVFYLFGMMEGPSEEGISSVEAGAVRIRRRKLRRPDMPTEWPILFHLKYGFKEAKHLIKQAATFVRLTLMMRRIWKNKDQMDYRDEAIAPVDKALEGEILDRVRGTKQSEKRLARQKLEKVG